jgi:hypothetical protein
MTLNDTTIRTLQHLVVDGKRRRPDLASRIERALTVLLFREREYLGCGAYTIANERGAYYTVTRQSCTCPDAVERGMVCKHQLAVGLLVVQRDAHGPRAWRAWRCRLRCER